MDYDPETSDSKTEMLLITLVHHLTTAGMKGASFQGGRVLQRKEEKQ